ncbi:MAG: hypothetical protein J5649_00480 [Lachnospiraceae bacterium]|nr:hypothetical protein [Lachnospiraceae bacterium]
MYGLAAFLATDKPSVGAIIGIVVFFVAIIGLSIWSTVTASKKGAQKIKDKYGDQIIDEGVFSKSLHYFFTQNEFLVQKYNVVFAIYRLSDIRFIDIRWDSVQRTNVLWMTDAEGNRLKPAEVVGGTKAAQKMYGGNLVGANKEDMQKIVAALLKHAPHIQFLEKK